MCEEKEAWHLRKDLENILLPASICIKIWLDSAEIEICRNKYLCFCTQLTTEESKRKRTQELSCMSVKSEELY